MFSILDLIDLRKRLDEVVVAHRGLKVVVTNPNLALPEWLSPYLDLAEQTAEHRMPVVALMQWGRSADQTLCLVQLADLEQLLFAADGGVLGAWKRPSA